MLRPDSDALVVSRRSGRAIIGGHCTISLVVFVRIAGSCMIEHMLYPPERSHGMNYDAYIFDLDGTIYLGDQLLPGAAETIAALRAAGRRTIFLSNNPTKTRDQYAAKLTKMGIPTPIEDIV